MALKHPKQKAIVVTKGRDSLGHMRHSHITYEDLDSRADELARGLLQSGYAPGTRAAMMIPPSLELFICTFALFRANIAPVFIDPGIGVKNFGKCIEEADPDYFMGINKAHLARHILRWRPGKWKKTLTVGKNLFGCTDSFAKASARGRTESSTTLPKSLPDIAAILFTSGSTGIPKGAIYTHENFRAQIDALGRAFDIEPGEIDLCTFPLFALFAPALGMTAVIPEMDFTRPAQVDPHKIFLAAKTFQVTNMFGSPALLKKLSQHSSSADKSFTSLRRVISAGAPVPASTMTALKAILPESCPIYTPYGATESLPVAITSSDSLLHSDIQKRTATGSGVCVGHPVPSIKVRIIRVTDEPIDTWSDDLLCSQGEIGEITVLGPQVTASYFGRPQANLLAKIDDSGRTVHRMGDLGYLDSEGRLWFCGRKTHRVAVEPGRDIYTIPGESIFNQNKDVSRSAIVGLSRTGKYKSPVLCVETLVPLSKQRRQKLTEELLNEGKKFPETKDINRVLFHKSFPVDIRHNSKIFREKLAIWAEKEIRH
ncbi:MAG: AMP-binding protein [Pseudobacteriovorax sp.]|nr:AMP-binding protein [Pseudobacteriovorax sp.]